MQKIWTILLVLIVLFFMVYARWGMERINAVATIFSDAVGDIVEELQDADSVITGSLLDVAEDDGDMVLEDPMTGAVMDEVEAFSIDSKSVTGYSMLDASVKEVVEPIVVGSTGTLEDVGDEYYLYSSETLGFSMQLPKKISVSYCEGKEVASNILVFEDSDSAYIGPDTLYDTMTCKAIVINSLSLMLANEANLWKITPESATKDVLDTIAKTVYKSEGCTIKEFVATGLGDTENVVMNTTGPETEDGKTCFLNYKSIFKYSESAARYVWWSGGQDVVFRLGSEIYDDVMTDSFQFIE